MKKQTFSLNLSTQMYLTYPCPSVPTCKINSANSVQQGQKRTFCTQRFILWVYIPCQQRDTLLVLLFPPTHLPVHKQTHKYFSSNAHSKLFCPHYYLGT